MTARLPLRSSHIATAAALASALALCPERASAESGVLNLHLDLGVAAPVLGDFGPPGGSGAVRLGGVGQLSLDWQLAQPFALELTLGGGYIADSPTRPGTGGNPYFNAALGARLRFLDNREGYANEPGGDFLGNYWVSAHLGYHLFDGNQFGIDLGTGYEWSLVRPLQAGVFARAALMFDFNPTRQHDLMVVFGISLSLELTGRPPALDTDGDGLADEREVQRWRTDPRNPDTDGDGLNDGLETRTNTNPTNPDSDGDTLRDGQEDANHNGSPDQSESDPRVADTDHGGVNDGWEAAHPPHDVRNRDDDDSDHDRVLDDRDECANTPRDVEVDARGCTVLRAELVLEGINFETGSADILPTSEESLSRAAQILRDNPEVRVEIAGHTDNVGNAGDNLRLSQARAESVRTWLEGHDIPRSRMTVRGYGMTRPRATNDTDEGRAQNRRIEFRRLDSPASSRPSPNSR